MNSPLSPAAKAVLNAYVAAPPDHSVYDLPPDCGIRALAAALLVTADRVEDLISDTGHPEFTQGVLAAAHFLNLIATELKTTNV
jgi:hypothetical protein